MTDQQTEFSVSPRCSTSDSLFSTRGCGFLTDALKKPEQQERDGMTEIEREKVLSIQSHTEGTEATKDNDSRLQRCTL